MKPSTLIIATVLVLCANAAFAADDLPIAAFTGKPAESLPAAPADADKPWAVQLTLDYTCSYFYRGYRVVDRGLIFQPGIEFTYAVFDQDGLTISPYAGLWNNITEEKLGDGSPQNWTEAYIYGGVRAAWRHFELDLGYAFDVYPNHSAGQLQELGIGLGYDDAAWWESNRVLASISPHAGVYFEMEDRGDDDRNVYAELGIEPTFKPLKIANIPVTFSVPLTLGMSPDGYFVDSAGHNEFFAFASAGVKVEVPFELNHMTCTVETELTYHRLFAQSAQDANNGDPDAVTARVGLRVDF